MASNAQYNPRALHPLHLADVPSSTLYVCLDTIEVARRFCYTCSPSLGLVRIVSDFVLLQGIPSALPPAVALQAAMQPLCCIILFIAGKETEDSNG